MKCPFSTKSVASGAQPRPDAPPGAPDASSVPGLVIFRTSDTPDPDTIEIDPIAVRLKRMRRSITVAARLFAHTLGPRQFKPAMLTLTYRDVDGFKPLHIVDADRKLTHLQR